MSSPAVVEYDDNGVVEGGVLNVETPEAFAELYSVPLGAVRGRCYYGGRGSAKSWQVARALLIHGVQRPLRILCTREFQSSVKDSVHRLLKDQIAALGLGSFYRVTDTSIVGANGTRFLFKGIRKNIGEIKSTEGIDICWLEEAESVSAASWRVLTPTIRKEGSEIWVTFNPALPTDATYERMVLKSPANWIVRQVNFEANPFLPAVLDEEQKELAVSDPDAWAHVWGGQPWMRSDAQVLAGKWKVLDFTPDESWGVPLYGTDFGFALDPSVFVRVWTRNKRLYLDLDEGKPQMSNDQLEAMYRSDPLAEGRMIRGDSARPETISEMKSRGLKMEGAKKWPGSVEDGISHLRSYELIVIHPRCKRAIAEARLYRYKVDPRTEEVLPILIDKHNHVWDAVRYALGPLIRRRLKPGLLFGSGGGARKDGSDGRDPDEEPEA